MSRLRELVEARLAAKDTPAPAPEGAVTRAQLLHVVENVAKEIMAQEVQIKSLRGRLAATDATIAAMEARISYLEAGRDKGD